MAESVYKCLDCGVEGTRLTAKTVLCTSCRKRRAADREKARRVRLGPEAIADINKAYVNAKVEELAEYRRKRWLSYSPEKRSELAAYYRKYNAERRRRESPEEREARKERHRQWSKAWSAANLDKVAAKSRRQYSKDPLSARMSSRMRKSLYRGKQGRSWREWVPYTLDQLRSHLERQFVKGMTWDNFGKWHIDHIQPVSSFTYQDPTDSEFQACWALSNLRPLWALENHIKHAKREALL
jgi:DNA-directed RNA polymerase subunit RPC12/RpoP